MINKRDCVSSAIDHLLAASKLLKGAGSIYYEDALETARNVKEQLEDGIYEEGI